VLSFTFLKLKTRNKLLIQENKILSPKDDHPFMSSVNFDGSTAYQLGDIGVFSSRDIVTANTVSVGAWVAQQTGSTSATSVTAAQYKLNSEIYKFSGFTNFSGVTGDTNILSANSISTVAKIGRAHV
jgi:hypothetical protein